MRRLAGIGISCVALLALVAPALAAPMPEGPRLSFSVWKGLHDEDVSLTLQTVGADGKGRQTLTGRGRIEPTPFDGGSWSPDGSTLAFSGSPGGGGKEAHDWIYLVSADGGRPVAVPHTREGRDPVFSPDGTAIAFSRTKLHIEIDFQHLGRTRDYFSTTAWIIDLETGRARQLTKWRNGLAVEPTSFSPDGQALLATRERGQGAEVVAVDPASGRMSLFAREARSAVFSPDGTRVALVSYRDRVVVDGEEGPLAMPELYVVAADGSGWLRLTRNRKEEEVPSWDPSGQRLAFARATDLEPFDFSLGFTNVIVQINADGTCPSPLVGRPRSGLRSNTALHAPTWRPGAGREAGPISC